MKHFVPFLLAAFALTACNAKPAQAEASGGQSADRPVVYITQEISGDALVKIFQAIGVEPQGNVAIKVSTGEPGGHNFLNPQMVKPLADLLGGTVVECNTAYRGKRFTSADHKQTFIDHGWTAIAPCDLMDDTADVRIPVRDTLHLKYNLVGEHLLRYDFLVNLAHFKGHAMGGFGGVLKNQSIGIASRAGKAYIHTAGATEDPDLLWSNLPEQDHFLESMAAAADAVHQYFNGTKNAEHNTHCVRTVYINVMNNLSVDCDCDSHPADPEMRNIGILASLDPVALDQACVDLVFNYPSSDDDNAAALIERINSRHGLRTIERAAEIGLGSRDYTLVSIDGQDMLKQLQEQHLSLVVRNRGEQTIYTQRGVRDLWQLHTTNILRGAAVADKVIGKGAAALMIAGGVKRVTTLAISRDALAMLQAAGVEVVCDNVLDYIENRDKTGECPLEQRLHGIDDPAACLPVISDFVKELDN